MIYPRKRRGAANEFVTLGIAGVIVLVVLVTVLVWITGDGGDAGPGKLVMYCAAGLRVPVEEIAERYAAEHGVGVELQYGGSNTLLSQLEVNPSSQADLYLAADGHYVTLAKDKGLAAETIPIATMRPVIAVGKGNPKNIAGLADLLRDDVRVALGNPDQAAIGRAVRDALSVEGVPVSWSKLEARVTETGVFKPTVSEVANDVKLGSVDAGIVWDTSAALPKYRAHVEAIEVEAFASASSEVTVAVLNATSSPAGALRFARYLTARDRGLPVFEAYGFSPVEGDVWAWKPEITFFCGAVNRRAVDEVIKSFEQREGVTVNTIYNGCGILTGQMRTINQEQGGKGFPDVYMACDRYYLENVRNWFQEDVDVSDADIVIAVPKGNPGKIRSLADLTRPGVRVSVGQPEQCTIGALTRIMLEKEGVYDEVMANVVMQTASSAMLVPSVVTKSVDATLAYVTDTKAESDKVDAVVIGSAHAKAVQPFSIARVSEHKVLGRRLFQAVASARDRFEEAGFHFRLVDDGNGEGSEASGDD